MIIKELIHLRSKIQSFGRKNAEDLYMTPKPLSEMSFYTTMFNQLIHSICHTSIPSYINNRKIHHKQWGGHLQSNSINPTRLNPTQTIFIGLGWV